MTDVFLDTVGLIAVWDSADQWHAPADASYRALVAQGRRLVTTNFVLLECGNAAARRPYRQRVDALRRALRDEGLVFDPTVEEFEEAWAAYDRGAAGQAGVVDHVSFLVMRRLGLTEVLTNDRHFNAAGFQTLF
jgi:predicted nucleic acid-binding protein